MVFKRLVSKERDFPEAVIKDLSDLSGLETEPAKQHASVNICTYDIYL